MMDKNEIKLIIFPDIHGRAFWKEAIKGNEDKTFVFLGDYIDPYGYEKIYPDEAWENFQEILKFKEEHFDNVILLLGNHDLHYISNALDGGRKSYDLVPNMVNLLNDKKDWFQMCYETECNGKKYLLSHAGILKGWTDSIPTFPKEDIPTFINGLYQNNRSELLKNLYSISFKRGGFHDHGSMIWADMTEHFTENRLNGYFQIFGHTQWMPKNDKQMEDALKEMSDYEFACIDIHRPFVLTVNGEIYPYGTV